MPRLLYVGAGHDRMNPFPKVFPGYDVVRLDADPTTKPDHLADARLLREWIDSDPDAEHPYQGVALAHTLEHFTEAEGLDVLKGCRYALAGGGIIAVSVPNLKLACSLLVNSHPNHIAYMSNVGPIRPIDMLYGHQPSADAHPLMRHHYGFTSATLQDALTAAGFAVYSVTDDDNPENTELHAYGRVAS